MTVREADNLAWTKIVVLRVADTDVRERGLAKCATTLLNNTPTVIARNERREHTAATA